MEIRISGGIVRSEQAPHTPRVVLARKIANLMSLACQRAGAKIVCNIDANYIGVRMDTHAGPVVLEVPAEQGAPFRIIQELIEPDALGRDSIERLRIPPLYRPAGVALTVSEFMHSRGLFSAGRA